MDIANTSSSGHIIEFNRDTGVGFIEESSTKQVLLVQLCSFKQRSRRYLTNDNEFLGELFDFDIIVKQKNDDGVNTFEAVNVRHRVLKCNVEGCPRLKAFTNMKALEDHINIRHTLKKKKEETSHSSSLVSAKKPKKERRSRPKPILINLASNATVATIGRFIGKQGINLKQFQQQNQVKLQLVNNQKTSNSVQISITPNAGVAFDINSISKKLKSQWEQCVRTQQVYEEIRVNRLQRRHSFTEPIFTESAKDSRYRTDLRSVHGERLKQQELQRRSRYRQTESSVRIQERHSSLNKEGHRSAATFDKEYRQKSIFNYLQPKKTKKTMKEKQWLVNEQLQDLERLSV
jgi:hypothetical protein